MSITRTAKISILALVLVFTAGAINSAAQKLTPDEIIARHLDSIGTKDKRDSIKNQLIYLDAEMEASGIAGVYGGKAIIFSERDKNVWGMNFNANNYEPDKFGYNGKKTRVAFIRPGERSALGGFILENGKLVEESLFGGVLSGSWVFHNLATKKPKLSFDGTKKVDGKEAFVLSYSPKGGSDMDIKVFFDVETFRHVRTEYLIVRQAALGSIDSSAGRDSSRERMTETFSDFKTVGGLNLPSTYKINYNYFGGSSAQERTQKRNRDIDWRFKLTNFSFNQQADDKAFEVDAK